MSRLRIRCKGEEFKPGAPSPTYGAKHCSQGCADVDAYDTLDEREIAFARDDRELDHADDAA